MKRGIDISSWQGELTLDDIKKLKDQIDFIIIRCGYTSYGKAKNKIKDRYFENNYSLCKQVGIPVGTYYYSCATTLLEAEQEADFILSLIQEKQFEYPISIDTEDNHDTTNPTNSPVSQYSIGKKSLTEIIKRICEIIQNKQNYVSIYSFIYWFQNNLVLTELTNYDKWIAQWSDTVNFDYEYGMWQYSSKGIVNGISGNVDLDYAYKDFPGIMKQSGLNGFEKEHPEKPDIPNVPEKPDIPNVPDKPEIPDENDKGHGISNCFKKIYLFFKKIFK